MKLKKYIKFLLLIFIVHCFLFVNFFYAQKASGKLLSKKRPQEELIGGVINKSDLKIGFLNNGSFSAPLEFIPDLSGAFYEKYGYLGKLDLWIGIPEGPWTPTVWNADSQKYVSLGATVSGSVYEPNITGTDWSTINATNGIFYTEELLYSDVYGRSNLFDFILAPTSEYEHTWPKNALTGYREWPGKWKQDLITGEPIIGEFIGDQNVFLSFDDKNLADRLAPDQPIINNYGWGFNPQRGYAIGAEVFVNIIGFQEAYAANIIFFDLQIINTSEWNYNDTYLGLYYESENPWYVLSGYNPTYERLKTRYIKNETDPATNEVVNYNLSYNYDYKNYYLQDVKYFGVQLLKTPLAKDDLIDNDDDGWIDEPEGEELGLTGWHYFPPSNMIYYPFREKLQYKLLSGDPSGLGNNIDRMFFFPDAEGNLDPNFDDPDRIFAYRRRWSPRRASLEKVYNLLSCGPIDWQKGDTLNFVFGILVADSLNQLKTSARFAKKMVENGYRGSEGPPPPKVTAVPGDGKIVLYWDQSAENAVDFITGYQDFEGYKIYRTTSDPKNNDWGERIIDHERKLVNFIPVTRCDLQNGIHGYEKVYPFQKLGDDTGLFHLWTDSTVTNGVTYWYSVCSYDFGVTDSDDFNPKNFNLSPMKECPKGTNPDTDINLVKVIPGKAAADQIMSTVELERIPGAAGNGIVEAVIVDPQIITGHDYIISFEDTTFGYAVYDLFDETENIKIYEKVQHTNGEEGALFDGIKLFVQRYDKMEILNDKTYWSNINTGELSDCTWKISGGYLTMESYPSDYEIRFIDHLETGVKTNKTAPFEIWNISLNKKCVWDIFYDSKTDSTDSLLATWSSGDLIYIWDNFEGDAQFTLKINITEYSYYSYAGKQNNAPQPGDVAHISLKMPFTTGDRYRIKTTKMQKDESNNTALKEIKVVPNPYNVFSSWELNNNDSKIQFINLPTKCTIHIFSMTGEKVRTLYHNDPFTDYEYWDLLNHSNLKVSYGLYLFVAETGDGKKLKGKFSILR